MIGRVIGGMLLAMSIALFLVDEVEIGVIPFLLGAVLMNGASERYDDPLGAANEVLRKKNWKPPRFH